MLRIDKVRGFLVGACFALIAGEASAVPVYDTPADLTGTRTLAAGDLIKGGGSAGFNSASISWTITSNNNNTLHYSYTVDTNSMQGLSHFILDLSDNCGNLTTHAYDATCFSNFSMTGGTLDSIAWQNNTTQQGDPGQPAGTNIIGLRIIPTGGTGQADFTFAFDSIRAPVWADFYAKGGNGTTNGFSLFNAGLGFESTDSNKNHFIAMPDTQNCDPSLCGPPCLTNCCGPNCGPPPPVPEPASIALLGVGLLGAGFAGRRKKRS